MNKTYRVGVIGATGRGDYGHGLDTAFLGVERAEIVAIADDHEPGRQKTAQRLGTPRQFADYRQMLAQERLDIVCIGPRWVTDRLAMVQAVAAAGCHIYCEKPFLADLETLDQARAACDKAKIHLQMAHQWRGLPAVQKAMAQLRSGYFGRLLRLRARPKDDSRGGGEELLVHGTHWFDLMITLAGHPQWASGHIMHGDRDAVRTDVRQGSEPVGPVIGDSIVAVFGFAGGVRGFFDSTASTAPNVRKALPNEIITPHWDFVYGLTVECEKATLSFRQPGDVYVYPAGGILPDNPALQWEKTIIPEWHFTKEHLPRNVAADWLHRGNQTMASDLIQAIEQNRSPLSPLANAASITEMVQGVYRSHLDGGRRVAIPAADRHHPLLS